MQDTRPSHTKFAAPALILVLLAACESPPTAPVVDVIAITTRANGSFFDADGYLVHIDGGRGSPIAVSTTEEITADGRDGSHMVMLTGVADNCAVVEPNPRALEVPSGGSASTRFDVECTHVPRDLAFTTDRDGNDEIYALGSDGRYLARLTINPLRDYRPAWSGDGSKIAFIREANVVLIDVDGSNARFARGPGDGGGSGGLAWSPDGTRLTYTLWTPAEDTWDNWFCTETALWSVNADGTQATKLVTGHGASWSPDGTRLAFTFQRDPCSDGELYIVRADGSNPISLTDDSADQGAAWSPDGTRIAFTSSRDGNGDIYVISPDGSDLRRLTSHRAWDSDARWSPDGTQIAFTSERDGNLDIYVMNADGSGLRRLTTHPAADEGAVWSPDGTQIAFTTDRDGNAEIYVIDASGSDPVNLTNHPGEDRDPAWLAMDVAASPSPARD
jgi:Tol biopolymer transport system component